jgi:hypothetical protein
MSIVIGVSIPLKFVLFNLIVGSICFILLGGFFLLSVIGSRIFVSDEADDWWLNVWFRSIFLKWLLLFRVGECNRFKSCDTERYDSNDRRLDDDVTVVFSLLVNGGRSFFFDLFAADLKQMKLYYFIYKLFQNRINFVYTLD